MSGVNRPRTRNRSIADRLMALSEDGPNGCRVWRGATNKKVGGYGMLNVEGKPRYVHRLAWEAVNGAIPAGKHVCHHCDTPLCINPEHMFLGDQAANMADKVAKERQHRGEEHPLAKLTADDILAIRASDEAHVALAERHGVTFQTIAQVRNGNRWRHIKVVAVDRAPTVRPDRRGEKSNLAKLTADKVREIRAANGTLAELSKRFGVAESTISLIRNRKIWKHVE